MTPIPKGEWKKRLTKWIEFLNSLKHESIPKYKRRQAASVAKQVQGYRDFGIPEDDWVATDEEPH